jgi:hypothetical protein
LLGAQLAPQGCTADNLDALCLPEAHPAHAKWSQPTCCVAAKLLSQRAIHVLESCHEIERDAPKRYRGLV